MHWRRKALPACAAAIALLWNADAPAAELLAIESKVFKSDSGVKVEGESGRLVVPEVRGAQGGRKIELAFVRLRSLKPGAAAPLVYLEGGPGASSTWMAGDPRSLEQWVGVLQVCDVILLDQRGTGASTPSLTWRWDGPIPLNAFADEKVALQHALEVSRRARAALVAKGFDLRGYTSVESADDIDDLRAALKLERISLLGFSYGTHLGLAFIRRHGDRVERAILAGIEGPDMTWKLPEMADVAMRRLSQMVAADPGVGHRVPDLMALFQRVLGKLEAAPMVVRVEIPGTGDKVDIPVGPIGLKLILRIDLGDASDLPVFPRLLASIDQGDTRLLQWFVQKRIGLLAGTNGMSMIMDCASGASARRLELIKDQTATSLFGLVVNAPFPDVCPVWEAPDLGPEFRGPLVSRVRTLLLSGSLDWNTPPYQAEEILWGFSNGTHLIVRNAGHEQILTHPEIRKAVVRFLSGEDVSDVRAAWPPLRFVPLEGFDPEATHPSVPRS